MHRISFISRDVSDARAFGYVYGPGDGTHKFFGIKTEKAVLLKNSTKRFRNLFGSFLDRERLQSRRGC